MCAGARRSSQVGVRREGIPWRDLPRRQFGPWQPVWKRHRHYAADGRWGPGSSPGSGPGAGRCRCSRAGRLPWWFLGLDASRGAHEPAVQSAPTVESVQGLTVDTQGNTNSIKSNTTANRSNRLVRMRAHRGPGSCRKILAYTMVLSFRPRCPLARDGGRIPGRNIGDLAGWVIGKGLPGLEFGVGDHPFSHAERRVAGCQGQSGGCRLSVGLAGNR